MTTIGTLFSYHPNPRAMKALAAANINNLTLTFSPSFQFNKSNKEEPFLSDFPLGKVPAFKATDGTILFESDAIAQYCAESGPASAQLLGSTAIERAKIRMWICFSSGEVMENVQNLWIPRMGLRSFDATTEKVSTKGLVNALTVLERQLEGGKWLVGKEGFSKFIDAEMRGEFPSVVSWYQRVLEVEGVRQAFGEKDFIEKRRGWN